MTTDLSHCRFGIYDLNFTLVGWGQPMLHKQRLAHVTYLLRDSPADRRLSLDGWEHRFRAALDKYDDQYEVGMGDIERMSKVLRDLDVPSRSPWLLNQLLRIEYDETFGVTYLYPGAREELAREREAGLSLGLCCNGNPNSVNIFRRHGLSELFDFAAFSCEVGVRKPEPAIYQAVMDKLGADPAHTFYVGDGGDREFDGVRAAFPDIKTVRVRSPEVADQRDPASDSSLITDLEIDSVADMATLFQPVVCST